MVQTIGQLLINNTTPIAVRAQDPVLYAVRAMNDSAAGSVLVLDTEGELVGIFTERDVLTRVIEGRCDARNTPVGAVMTPTPVTVDRDTPLKEALRLMRWHEVCHLPVVENDEVVGVVALRDLAAAMTQQLTYENRALRGYIHGPLARASESAF